MADITQVLGFDASQALDALNQLDKQLNSLNQSLGKVASSGFNVFNKSAAKSVGALKQLSTASREAQTAVNNLKIDPKKLDASAGAKAFDSLFTSASKSEDAVKKTGSAAEKTGKQAEQAGKKGKQAGDSMSISFQTLARIITTQLIVRAFGALQRALTDAVSNAIEFNNAVAEIATIDTRGGGGFAEIADEVEQLAVAFGADLGDVGKGL
ncbi:MAG: hypothetical protein ACXAEN_26250, partial [Candidatus Thorarchaeota archaeon]